MPKHALLMLDRPLRELLKLQARGKIRRTIKKLSSPRRLIPTLLVAALMILYAVKVYIAIAYSHTPADMPIEGLAPVGMLYILLLKLLGVCIDRKKSGAGYRHEETHNLIGGPFRIEQVRLFRVIGHAVSIFFTSLFAAAFFAFHVKSFAAAIVGSYAAMLFTYLAYSVIAVAAASMTEKAYRRCRMVGCLLAGGMAAWLLFRASQQGLSNLAFIKALGDEAILFSKQPGVAWLMVPFVVFTKVIVAESFVSWIAWLVPAVLFNYLALQLLLFIEPALQRRAEKQDRTDFVANQDNLVGPNQVTATDLSGRFDRVRWFGGAGPIVWRQMKGILRLKRGLCWLLIPLASVFAVGAYLAYDAEQGSFQTVAVVIVMSSVFLPGLLPFDFRGDLKALPALKLMPIRPIAVVAGQFVVPVALLTLFQAAALSTMLLHDVSEWSTVLWTVLFLIPTNILIISLENIVFLLYPYRVAEFDMQATVRRVVMLMAKFCVIFFVALLGLLAGVGVLGLKMAVAETSLSGALGNVWLPMLVTIELAAMLAAAYAMVRVTTRIYRRFDLSEDLPLA